MSESWREHAACRDKPQEWWFPPPGHAYLVERAVKVCDGCPVRCECWLAGRLESDGVWGGVDRDRGRRRYVQRMAYERRQAAS